MAESPTKYAKDIQGAGASAGEDGPGKGTTMIGGDLSGIINEDELIDRVT